MFAPLQPATTTLTVSVDTEDYNLWRSTFGSTNRLAADGNSNGVIDAADYVVWRKNAGSADTAGATGVPEPSAVVIIAVLVCAMAARREPWGTRIYSG